MAIHSGVGSGRPIYGGGGGGGGGGRDGGDGGGGLSDTSSIPIPTRDGNGCHQHRELCLELLELLSKGGAHADLDRVDMTCA